MGLQPSSDDASSDPESELVLWMTIAAAGASAGVLALLARGVGHLAM